MHPTNIPFVRGQVAELTGLSDDVIGYWIKERLLVPEAASAGKGRHLRFDYLQLYVAAVLREMRAYGANIEALRGLAGLLQKSIETGSFVMDGIRNYDALSDATEINRARDFGPASPEEHFIVWEDGEKVQYSTFETWVLARQASNRPFAAGAIDIEKRLRSLKNPETFQYLEIYKDLIADQHFTLPNADFGPQDWFWMLAQADGKWIIHGNEGAYGASDELLELPSFVTINLSKAIRSIWSA